MIHMVRLLLTNWNWKYLLELFMDKEIKSTEITRIIKMMEINNITTSRDTQLLTKIRRLIILIKKPHLKYITFCPNCSFKMSEIQNT